MISRRLFLSIAGAPPFAARAQSRSTVALVRGEDRRKNVFDALVAIDDLIRPALKRKKYVLIKPNGVAVKNQLGSTHADALRGIFDYLGPRWKGPVVIAESSKDDTWDAYRNFGYDKVAAEYRRFQPKLVDLNEEDRHETLELMDANLHQMQVRLAGRLFDPDAFIIGSAIPKAHDAVVATLSVKNMVMSAPVHSTKKHTEKFHEKYRFHCGCRQMHFNIALAAKRMRPFWGVTVIDGFEGMEGNGPLAGTPVPSRFAIASTDFVAADRVGVEAMGVNPAWVGYLNNCDRARLGNFDLEKIDLRGGVRIEDVRRIYKLHSRIERQLEWMGPLVAEKRG